MRVLASALVALVAGCGGVVPLDSDGGGTPPSTCRQVIDQNTSPTNSVRFGVYVAGVRTLVGGTDLYCRPAAAGGTRFTCAFDGSVSGASVALVVAFRAPVPTDPSARLDLGAAFAIERVTAEGGTDTSAWGGPLRLWNPTAETGGVHGDLRGADPLEMFSTMCSAAGSQATVSGFVRVHLCTNPDCR